ncbi:recombinase family protein, partial [Salmonella enterica subsp. enterica serovar Agona]|uniref:recombinase family protein n=1 Tax=Salmonella enterica TaxID=28901 RepID=UPI002A7531D6
MGHRAAIYCRVSTADQSCERQEFDLRAFAGCAGYGTVAKLAMRQPFVLFKGLTFQKLCLPGAFRPGD